MKTKLSILILTLVLITTSGVGCKGGDPAAKKALLTPVEINMWGVFDASDDFTEIISAYNLTRPSVKINYTKVRWEDYETKLIEAWAEGTGPDIFVISNNWANEYANKILPLPTNLKIPSIEKKAGIFGSEDEAVIKNIPTLNINQLKNIFPDIVTKDLVVDNQILGLPLSIDTLALFYNRDHLNAAGITAPPSTWQELTTAVKLLTKQDDQGEIIRAGVSLGGANNINRSNDILSLLMLQNGTNMTSANKITFDQPSSYDQTFYPGEHALKFYTDFSLPSKEVYTWNSKLPESLELFSSNKLSMLFGFAYQIPLIQSQARNINFTVAPVPHINLDGSDYFGLPINWGSYWAYTVFKNSTHPNEAWDFILFMTTHTYQDENGQNHYYAENYLNKTGNPPALKGLINKYATAGSDMAVFANQILTATNWYHGKNSDHMNTVFKSMINEVVSGQSNIKKIIKNSADAISQTY